MALISAVSGGVDFAPVDLDRDELAALGAGGTVVQVTRDRSARDAAASIVGVIDIAAPRETVWEIMLDCARAPKIVPHMKSCRVLEEARDGAYDIREHIVSYAFLFPNVKNVFRSDYRKFEEIRFHRTDGDLRIMEGIWTLETLPEGRARVSYRARLAIGVAAPRFLIRAGLRDDIPEILRALRDEAEREARQE